MNGAIPITVEAESQDLFGGWFATVSKENDQCWNEQGEISQRSLHAQLAGDDSAKATALERLTMQNVNVVKREGAEAEQEYGRPNRAQPDGARNQQQDRSDDLRRDHREGRGPLPALIVDVGRAEQLGYIAAEFLEDCELRAGSEKKKRRQTEAADVSEPLKD